MIVVGIVSTATINADAPDGVAVTVESTHELNLVVADGGIVALSGAAASVGDVTAQLEIGAVEVLTIIDTSGQQVEVGSAADDIGITLRSRSLTPYGGTILEPVSREGHIAPCAFGNGDGGLRRGDVPSRPAQEGEAFAGGRGDGEGLTLDVVTDIAVTEAVDVALSVRTFIQYVIDCI